MSTPISDIKLLFFTKYSNSGPSSRYRSFQYLPYLEQTGFKISVSPLFGDKYVENLYKYNHRSWFDIIYAILGRIKSLLFAHQFDLVIIEYEIFPYFSGIIEKLFNACNIPYIVDYDDALFHQYDNHGNKLVHILLKNKIAQVMQNAEMVIAGNTYLANYAQQARAKRIEIIPTVVDLSRYPEINKNKSQTGKIIIGWLGSPTTSKYLNIIAPVLADISKKNNVMIRLIGPGNVELPGVDFELLPWAEDSDISLGELFDIGIMPVPDEPWERGKCGFKLIQYMACGLPVVASPVGVNTEIVEHGKNGFLATDPDSWIKSLETLINDPDLCQEMGRYGRQKVEQQYSLQVTAPRMIELINSIVVN